MCDVTKFSARADLVEKFPHPGVGYFAAAADLAFCIAEKTAQRPAPGSRVLDLGCGIGDTVSLLLSRGFDAYGVDVGEWWGKDHAAYWQDTPIPSSDIRDRLFATDETAYRLPFPDGHFDFMMSSQVFEHVFAYEDVFREIGRVLKPGAISVHVFPGRGSLFEPHLDIPITAWSKSDLWLRMWSLVRRRHRKTWQEEYEFLRGSMESNNYPSRSELREYAAKAGVKLTFAESTYLDCYNGRPARMTRAAKKMGLGWAVSPVIERICQRTLIISR